MLLMLITLISLAYLFLSKDESAYIPNTDDAATIYRQACKHCHGNKGQGSGLFYPALKDDLSEFEIHGVITQGAWLMPAFTNVKDDTLEQLIHYIQSKSYK